jgi:hypothetical protein
MQRLSFLASLLVGCGSPDVDVTVTFPDPYTLTDASPERPDDMMKNALHDGWSQTGKLSVGSDARTLSMQQNFTAQHGGPGGGTYTIQFGVSPPPSFIFNAQARISWSTGSTSLTRLISIGNGATITGVAQAASVFVHDVSPTPSAETYRVDVLITPGTRAGRNVPPILEAGTFNLNDASPDQTLAVPQNAGVIMVTVTAFRRLQSALVAGDVMVFFRDPLGTTLTAFSVDPQGAAWVALPPNTFDVLIHKTAVGQTIIGDLIWGIEG